MGTAALSTLFWWFGDVALLVGWAVTIRYADGPLDAPRRTTYCLGVPRDRAAEVRSSAR